MADAKTLTETQWTLLDKQGSREVWTRRDPETGVTQYSGEEYVDLQGEIVKVEEVLDFDTLTLALAWLNGAAD